MTQQQVNLQSLANDISTLSCVGPSLTTTTNNRDIFEELSLEAGCPEPEQDDVSTPVVDSRLYRRIAHEIRNLPLNVDRNLKLKAIRILQSLPVTVHLEVSSSNTSNVTEPVTFHLYDVPVKTWLSKSSDTIYWNGEYHFCILHFEWEFPAHLQQQDIEFRMNLGGDVHTERLLFNEQGRLSFPLNARWMKDEVELEIPDEFLV